MNWEAVGAIGEVAGAIGVIATLLYLATQIRQATRLARADFFVRSIDGWIDFNLRLSSDEVLTELFWRALQTPEDLTPEEERRSRHLLSGIFRQAERLHFARRNDLMLEDVYQNHFSTLAGLSRTPGGMRWFHDWGSGMDPEFVRAIEGFEPTGTVTEPHAAE
jgi:hypothetical protein